MVFLFVREFMKLSQFSDIQLILLIIPNAILKLMPPIVINAILKLMLPITLNATSTMQLLSLKINNTRVSE